MMSSKKDLRIFFVEDNIDDIDLELYELQKTGYVVTYDFARNRKELLEKLPELNADVILADYSLPDITGYEAIALLKSANVDCPVILVTGEGNEQIAVDSLRIGAIDYIIKRNISGLSARVNRALEIWSDRKAKERAETEELRLQQLLYENQKMEAVGRLAGGIAHDFNNILTGVIGFSELCQEDVEPDGEVFRRLSSIVTLSRRGADLVKQLLIFSKKMTMEFRIIDLNVFVRGTIQFLRRIVEETIDIVPELHADEIYIECDTGQFTQVVMNLILNARDAMEGTGKITVKTELCGPGIPGLNASDPKELYCRLSVHDSGVGIPQENLNKIFEPFFTTKEVGRGTGLGLAIVFSVVKAHEGVIDVRSGVDEGTTFNVYLPVRSKPENMAVVAGGHAVRDVLNDVRGNETVLIAEDEEVIRYMLVSYMKRSGYTIIEAKDGREALDRYKELNGKIDVVVSDMIMPKMGGIELFQKLYAVDPSVKFILATGYSLTGQDEEILGRMSAICHKPFAPMKLALQIRDILR